MIEQLTALPSTYTRESMMVRRWARDVMGRHREDFAAGQKFASGQLRVDRERLPCFATELDAQRRPG